MTELARCQFTGCQSAFTSVEDRDKHVIIEHTSADLQILQYYRRRVGMTELARCQFTGCQSAFTSVEDRDKHVIIEHTSADLQILQYYRRRPIVEFPSDKREKRAPTRKEDCTIIRKTPCRSLSTDKPTDNQWIGFSSDDNQFDDNQWTDFPSNDNRRKRRRSSTPFAESPDAHGDDDNTDCPLSPTDSPVYQPADNDSLDGWSDFYEYAEDHHD